MEDREQVWPGPPAWGDTGRSLGCPPLPECMTPPRECHQEKQLIPASGLIYLAHTESFFFFNHYLKMRRVWLSDAGCGGKRKITVEQWVPGLGGEGITGGGSVFKGDSFTFVR